MGIMHTKAERTEKVEEIKAENRKKVKEIRAKKKELDAEVKKKARQVAADRKKRRAGITFRLFMLAIVPVIVMVLGLITTTVFSLKSGLEEEAMDGLELLSGAVQSSYEDIKGNYEYKNGKCATNETVGGIKFNKNGYASNLTQARCKLAARNFIARHSNANASNYEKFRSCFYYIMAYTNFVGYMDPTPQEFKTKDWVYKYSLQMFQNGLTGNCYGIASSVAAIAKELGYEPYVITIPDGHSFVMINGLYYDNMYGTLFGAATRPAYTIEHKIKF